MEAHRLALPSGFRIENYEIQAVLGKGGFGITYAAYDWTLKRHMAIKELLPDTIATRIEGSAVVAMGPSHEESLAWARERFVEEAQILAAFHHPNIIAVHRLIEANGTVYLVMDHLEGESYEARLRRIGHEPDQSSLMAVVGPILDGLQEVHAKGLLHRDIKPENILFDGRANPVLIDFGSARATVGATMTMTSIVTHGYSPIEQYQTTGRMGPWTDIYAMAAVMCRAITGEKPPVAADRVLEDGFACLSYMQLPGYSESFKRSVDSALRVRPEERPQSVRSWATQLRPTVMPDNPAQTLPPITKQPLQPKRSLPSNQIRERDKTQAAKKTKGLNYRAKLAVTLLALMVFLSLGLVGFNSIGGFLKQLNASRMVSAAPDAVGASNLPAVADLPEPANILAIDLSRSMLAEDFKQGENRQNRLEAVRSAARLFLQSTAGLRTGVVCFAGQPFVASEPTGDRNRLLQVLANLKIGLVEDGTAIGSAILSACRQLQLEDIGVKTITLISDGDNNIGAVTPSTAAQAARQLGVRVNVIATGSVSPNAPYPFVDQFGRTVYRNIPTTINEEPLKQLASITGGEYFRARTSEELREAFMSLARSLAVGATPTGRSKPPFAAEAWFSPAQAERLLHWTAYEDQHIKLPISN